MISSKGIFSEFPLEWTDKLPFCSWNTLGIIAILVFGLGNFISALFILHSKRISKQGNRKITLQQCNAEIKRK